MEMEHIAYKISVKEFLEDVKTKYHREPIIIEPEKEYQVLKGQITHSKTYSDSI